MESSLIRPGDLEQGGIAMSDGCRADHAGSPGGFVTKGDGDVDFERSFRSHPADPSTAT